jgi:hypothetical protein
MMLSFVLVTLVHPPRPAAKTAAAARAVLA